MGGLGGPREAGPISASYVAAILGTHQRVESCSSTDRTEAQPQPTHATDRHTDRERNAQHTHAHEKQTKEACCHKQAVCISCETQTKHFSSDNANAPRRLVWRTLAFLCAERPGAFPHAHYLHDPLMRARYSQAVHDRRLSGFVGDRHGALSAEAASVIGIEDNYC